MRRLAPQAHRFPVGGHLCLRQPKCSACDVRPSYSSCPARSMDSRLPSLTRTSLPRRVGRERLTPRSTPSPTTSACGRVRRAVRQASYLSLDLGRPRRLNPPERVAGLRSSGLGRVERGVDGQHFNVARDESEQRGRRIADARSERGSARCWSFLAEQRCSIRSSAARSAHQRGRLVRGADDAACDSALRFSRAFFLRWRSFFQRVVGLEPRPIPVGSLGVSGAEVARTHVLLPSDLRRRRRCRQFASFGESVVATTGCVVVGLRGVRRNDLCR